jgi:hypothetical protein
MSRAFVLSVALFALPTMSGCAVLPNHPALRAAAIGVGAALVVGAATRDHNPEAQPIDVRRPGNPCSNPEACR